MKEKEIGSYLLFHGKLIGRGKLRSFTKEEYEQKKKELGWAGCPPEKLEEHTKEHFRTAIWECLRCRKQFETETASDFGNLCPDCQKLSIEVRKIAEELVGDEPAYLITAYADGVETGVLSDKTWTFKYKGKKFEVRAVPDGGMLGSAHWAVVEGKMEIAVF